MTIKKILFNCIQYFFHFFKLSLKNNNNIYNVYKETKNKKNIIYKKLIRKRKFSNNYPKLLPNIPSLLPNFTQFYK